MPARPIVTLKPKPSLAEVLNGQSMLEGSLPMEYGHVETAQEALDVAVPKNSIPLRITIIWDNEVNNLDLQGVLERMRETGAAMVVKVEQLNGSKR